MAWQKWHCPVLTNVTACLSPTFGTLCAACASQTGCSAGGDVWHTCLMYGHDESKLACTTAAAGYHIVGTAAAATATGETVAS